MNKVVCPWCGEEMKGHDGFVVNTMKQTMRFRFRCNCGAHSPYGKESPNRQEGLGSALVAAQRRPPNKPLTKEGAKQVSSLSFTVIDKTTGEYPDVVKIARNEDWAKHLMWMDIDCFCITEDGGLVLMDDCGNTAYCPSDRFSVVFEEEQSHE